MQSLRLYWCQCSGKIGWRRGPSGIVSCRSPANSSMSKYQNVDFVPRPEGRGGLYLLSLLRCGATAYCCGGAQGRRVVAGGHNPPTAPRQPPITGPRPVSSRPSCPPELLPLTALLLPRHQTIGMTRFYAPPSTTTSTRLCNSLTNPQGGPLRASRHQLLPGSLIILSLP